ncbi:MAG: hypothetical protein AB1921_04135 [Thermodesulfobacteriota bacterium]
MEILPLLDAARLAHFLEHRVEPEPDDLLLRVDQGIFLLQSPVYTAEAAPGFAGPVLAEFWECRAVFARLMAGSESFFAPLSVPGERKFMHDADSAVLAALRAGEICERQNRWDDTALERDMFEET